MKRPLYPPYNQLEEKMPLPNHFVVELTDNCNLACEMCWLHGLKGVAKKRLFQKEISCSKLIKFFECLETNSPYIRFTGGEPFLKKDFLRLLRFMAETNIRCGRIATNGTLINKKIAGKLVDYNVERLTVSLDGDESTHDRIRGKGNFKRTMNAIALLQAEKEIRNVVFPEIEFVFTLSSLNYRALDKFFDIGLELGVKTIVQLLNWMNSNQVITHKKRLVEEFGIEDPTAKGFSAGLEKINAKAFSRKYLEVKNNIPKRGGEFLVRPLRNLDEILAWYSNQSRLFVEKPCRIPFSIGRISPKGSFMACRYIRVPFGSIAESEFGDSWNSAVAKKFRKDLLSGNDFEACKRCNCFG